MSDLKLSQSIVKHSIMLALFAIGTALFVGLVNEHTRDRIIAQALAAEQRALHEVFPSQAHDNELLEDKVVLDQRFNNLDLLGFENSATAYIGRLDGKVTGLVLPLEVHDGYNGDISLLLGLRIDGSVSGVRVTSHRETPGLGDKVELRISAWILGFDNKSLRNPTEAAWQVKKDGGDFDQFIGATITPRAVVNGIRKGLLFFEQNRDLLLSM